MTPEISVILAVFNEEQHLDKCLTSLARQKGINFEVIVVDDGSFNKIKNEKLKIKNGNRFYFYRIKHSGTAKARNFGAKKARGEILVFVDGDMEFAPDFLVKLTAPIRKGKAKGTFSTEELVANWDKVWARCWNWENGLPDGRRINPKRADMVKDFRAIKESEFTKVGGFDDIGYTDTWTLSQKLGYKPTPVIDAIYYHYNPEMVFEVFRQAVWIGGRKRKFGPLGKLTALIRASFPFSLIWGGVKAILYREPKFLLFKLVYDLGIFAGVAGSL